MEWLSTNIFACPSSHFKIKFNVFFHMAETNKTFETVLILAFYYFSIKKRSFKQLIFVVFSRVYFVTKQSLYILID